MYAAHFASALALKAKEPQAPTWGLLVGVGVLDLLFGPFVLAGIERASLTPGVSPGFSLDYIDWSHSLLMTVVWSVLFGAAFLRAAFFFLAAIFVSSLAGSRHPRNSRKRSAGTPNACVHAR